MIGVGNDIAAGKPPLSAEKKALLEKRLRGGAKAEQVRIPKAARRTGVPLSFAQQRLWFFDNLKPGSALYNLPSAVRIQGELDVAAVKKAFDVMVVRQESLRTRFVNEDGAALQVVQEAGPANFKVVDLRKGGLRASPDVVDAALQNEARKAFDLATGYLMRAVLFKTAAQEHVLLVTLHHIVSDAWSVSVLFREFALCYEAIGSGSAPILPPLPVQYVDYTLWQREGLANEAMEKHGQYWKQQLKQVPPLLELPTEKARPARQAFRGAWAVRTLPKILTAQTRDLSKQKNVTPFMLLLGVFKVLVYRHTQQADLVIGSPIAGRTHFETEGIIGFFVNTLVLRTDLSGNPSFSETLARVRKVTLEGYAHQDYPFDKLVEELQPARSSSYSPLVQVLFAFNGEDTQRLTLPGLKTDSLAIDTATSKFDLILTVQDQGETLALNAEYDVELFSAAAMERMLGHFQQLLEAVVANPEQRIDDVVILAAEERDLLMKEWDGKRTHYPANKSLGTLFQEQAELFPEKIAVRCGQQQLTYRALNEQTNALAWCLVAQGVKKGDSVVLLTERSLETVVAVLAIIKAGAGYVSLEPHTPTERLRGMLGDVSPAFILSQEKFAAKLEEVLAGEGGKPVRCAFLDRDKAQLFQQDGRTPLPQAGPEDVAYISFTSGSTGRPKGVRVPHRGVVRLVKNTDYAPFQTDEIFLQLAPLAFDASTLEIWGPLLNGGQLVVFPPHIPSMAELADLIRAQSITTLWLTAGLFHQLVEYDCDCFKGLRRVLAGGDVLSPAHVAKILGKCEIINGYGPTENTTFTCCHRITAESLTGRSVPIGRPIANTDVYVLDEGRKLVPIGVAGELYTGGDGLALDYLNAPELTAEKFIQAAIVEGAEKRLYRTGDKVRWLENGELEFLGRLDSQTKIRGFRVELSEIENTLKKHSSIADCLVVIRNGEPGQKELGAYWVSRDGQGISSERLRMFLQASLPDHMVPKRFAQVEKFPLNANGKVDRNLLPPLTNSSTGTVTTREVLEPRDKIERQLVKIWEDVLGIHPVGIQDNFFELGGHSLMAVKLVAQLEKVMGSRVPVAEVFLRPTVEQLAGYLKELQPKKTLQHIVEIQGKGAQRPLFLVHGVGGGMFWGYTNLANHLGKDQPIMAFSSQGLNGQEEFKTIREMAACYVAELLEYQPEGPYRLGGYCFGGNVAYEMARILEAQGQEVSLLALINCMPPNSSYDRAEVKSALGIKFFLNLSYWAGYFLQLEAKHQRSLLWWKLKGALKRLKRLGRHLRKQKEVVDVEDYVDLASQPEDRRELWKTHIEALMTHHPEPYNGQLTLFRTRGHSLWCSFDDSYGWDQLATKGTSIRYVAGAHESILEEPYVKATANELRICLQKDLKNRET